MNKNELIQLIEQKVRQILSEIVDEQNNRYSSTIQFYVYAKNDKDAIKETEKIVSELNRKYDNNSQILHTYANDFGNIKIER